MFFNFVVHRLTKYLLKNPYIDSSVQKRGIPGVPRCLEHNRVITQLIREACEGKGDLAVWWLDLAKAYSSIPHMLVKTTLEWYHFPSIIKDLVTDYYDNLNLRVNSGTTTSESGERCTMSLSLFSQAMNMPENQRNQIGSEAASHQSFHGWLDSNNIMSQEAADGSARVWRD